MKFKKGLCWSLIIILSLSTVSAQATNPLFSIPGSMYPPRKAPGLNNLLDACTRNKIFNFCRSPQALFCLGGIAVGSFVLWLVNNLAKQQQNTNSQQNKKTVYTPHENTPSDAIPKQIFTAIKNDDPQFFIDNPQYIDRISPNLQNTPLLFAAGNGKICVVKKLIELGANVNYKNPINGITPLLATCFHCPNNTSEESQSKHTILEHLLRNGAQTNISADFTFETLANKPIYSVTPLMFEALNACRGQSVAFEMLLENSPESIYDKNKHNQNILEFCEEFVKECDDGKYLDIIPIIIDQHCKNIKNAINNNNLELLKNNVNFSKKHLGYPLYDLELYDTTDRCYTPLMYAAKLGKKRIFNWLIKNGAEHNKILNGRTTLSIAKENRHEAIAKLLEPTANSNTDSTNRQAMPKAQIQQVPFYSTTPWKKADNSNSCGQLLLAKHRDESNNSTLPQEKQKTITHSAPQKIENKETSTASSAITETTTTSNPSIETYTIDIFKTVMLGNINNVQVWINQRKQQDQTLDITDKNGRTPFIVACTFGHQKIVQAFMDAGCNINAQDSVGNTALHYAIRQKKIEIVNLLCSKADCKVGLVNKKGVYPARLIDSNDPKNKIYKDAINNSDQAQKIKKYYQEFNTFEKKFENSEIRGRAYLNALKKIYQNIPDCPTKNTCGLIIERIENPDDCIKSAIKSRLLLLKHATKPKDKKLLAEELKELEKISSHKTLLQRLEDFKRFVKKVYTDPEEKKKVLLYVKAMGEINRKQ